MEGERRWKLREKKERLEEIESEKSASRDSRQEHCCFPFALHPRRTALNCGNLLSFLSYLLRIILEVKETIFLPNICSFLALDLLFKIFIDL